MYDSGLHDQDECILASDCEVNPGVLASTVDITLVASGRILKAIPIDRLTPLQPTMPNEYAMCITGDLSRRALQITAVDEDGCLCCLADPVAKNRDDRLILKQPSELVKITWPAPPR